MDIGFYVHVILYDHYLKEGYLRLAIIHCEGSTVIVAVIKVSLEVHLEHNHFSVRKRINVWDESPEGRFHGLLIQETYSTFFHNH